jgi:PAS domain S-box-containing protein
MDSPLPETELQNQLHEIEQLKAELELVNSKVESLKEIEQTLKDYLDNSIDVIHTVNSEGKFVFVSGAWERYFDLPVCDAIGKEFTQFVHAGDRDICTEYVQRIMSSRQEGKSPAYRVKVANGELRWIVTNGKSYVDKNGDLLFIGVSHDITDRIFAEEALLESEKRFSLSMDATSDGLWDWNVRTGSIYYSPGYFRMLGYEPNEFSCVLDTWKNLIHPDDIDAAISNNMDCMKNVSQSIHVEFRMKAKDGSWRWVLGRGKVVERDAKGEALRMIGSHVDITKRKDAEEILFRKDALLSITGSTAKVGGWEIDTDTMTLHWSEEVYHIHELDFTFVPNFSKGINFYAVESRPIIVDAVTRAIKFGESFDLELEFITDKGNHRWVHSIGKVIQENGKIRKVYGSIQDITTRKQVDEDLRASEALYRAIINASPYLITICDLDGRIKMFSPATLKLFGYDDRDEILGRLVSDFLVPEDRQRAMSDISLRVGGTKTGPNEYLAKHANGSTFYFEVSGEFIHNIEGVPIQMLLIGRDVSYRKQVELQIKLKNEELSKLNAEKDKFFSIISHDMRGPFNGFLGFTQILAKELSNLSKDEIQQIATGMNKSATNLFNLLENLLLWARIQQGLIPFVKEPIDLRRIVKQNIELMKPSANSKGIVIVNHILDETLVYGDQNMLRTIFRNLISNAVKFTPSGGQISVSSKINVEKCLEVSVIDSGIGMSQEMINDLFRIDKKPNRKGTEGEPSSGLGLILCREFVEKHGGLIWVESTEENQQTGQQGGSTFYFTLPLSEMKT